MRLWVHRVVPGCWEAWCPCCSDDPAAVMVVAQVGTWERAMWRAGEHVREVHRVLRASDPQPPAGTWVRDDCGTVWVNDAHRPCCWVRPDAGVHDPESWAKVAGNYGPVTVLRWSGDGDGA